MVQAPCKHCDDREIGCHSTCELYKNFIKENEAKKSMINKRKQSNAIHVAFIKDQRERRRRSRG